jgi:hypothetical protein
MKRVTGLGLRALVVMAAVLLAACPPNTLLTDVQQKVQEAQAATGGPVSVTGVTLNKDTTTIGVGRSELLLAVVTPSNAANFSVTWGTSSPSVASVSATGLVTGLASGSSMITVTTVDGGKTDFCDVTVQNALAILTTTAVSNITPASATGGGTVINDGGASVTHRGVCWNVAGSPTIADSHTDEGAGTGAFTSTLTGLALDTTYYVRAYATNAIGTEYGQQVSFTALALPTVATVAASAITGTTASGGGNVTSDGGAAVTARGVCWSTTANPTLANTHTTDGTGIGSFTSAITGLSLNTGYCVRAYATNSAGTAYGGQVTFTTLTLLPTVTTSAMSNLAGTTATGGGNVTSDGGATVSARGVCWSTTANPTTANSKTTDGTGTGSFASSLTGLALGTPYHVRAYATNTAGTEYGADIGFTTPTAPSVTTAAVSAITGTSATCGGNVTSDGGATVSARGVCWNTTGSPTTADSKTTNGTGAGTFTSSLTGLLPLTPYYVRAYATNSAGTSYGAQVPFSTISNAKAITAFSFTNPAATGTINEGAKTITVRLPFGTDPGSLVASFTTTGASVKVGSTTQVSGVTANNFYLPVSYIVTAADSSTATYTVTAADLFWTERTTCGSRTWNAIASSSDGTKLVAVAENNYIYTSADSGVTWTARTGPGTQSWVSVASSADGTKLAAAPYGGYIYTSTDSGVTWTARTGPGTQSWYSIASSSDGVKLAAGIDGGNIYTSTNSGVNWTPRAGSGTHYWSSIASSSDGTRLAAADFGITAAGGYLYTSTDSGVTWTAQTSVANRLWVSIASSSDGLKLAAVAQNDYIYTSTNGGTSWTGHDGLGLMGWAAIRSSADGTRLAAAAVGDVVYSSVDGGTWWRFRTEPGTRNWQSMACSSDGTKIFVAVNGGYIYTGQ